MHWECIHSPFTPASITSVVDTGFSYLDFHVRPGWTLNFDVVPGAFFFLPHQNMIIHFIIKNKDKQAEQRAHRTKHTHADA